MDYEKKYKKALTWMQSLYDGLHGATKKEAEHYFPELKESEDERIRKWLIGYFHQYKEDRMEKYANGLKVESIIAWLEKQGEHNAVDSSKTCKTETLMTLDEAIEHCKEKSCDDTVCGKEHKQLSEWLTELKSYRSSVAQIKTKCN